jgi:hypothetical protein
MIITLDESELYKCKKFANDVVSTNIDRYSQRNQTDIVKIIEDIYIGKIAEYAAYKLLLSRGKQVTEPDTKIYSAHKKSFSADLYDGKYSYHVKCMKTSTAERFGLSWSFQIEDKLITSPTDNDVLILCEINNDIVDIKSVIKANKVTHLYTKPVLKKLWEYKRVLTYNQICGIQ